MSMGSLTQQLVQHLFSYDTITGQLTHRNPRARCVKPGDVAGYVAADGRVQLGIGGRMYRAHRVIWLYMTGSWPVEDVDHADGNPSNNAWNNLRECSKSQNGANVGCKPSNKSGFKGVTKSGHKWAATITKDYRAKYLGSFSSAEEAAAAYDTAAVTLHGPFARTNKSIGLL